VDADPKFGTWRMGRILPGSIDLGNASLQGIWATPGEKASGRKKRQPKLPFSMLRAEP
jgi:hypothetical protein